MINIVKSQPAPLCLAKEAKKRKGNYRCGDVVRRIQYDFHNKCYICETKGITGIQVEHFRPQSKYPNLIFDWNNLFFVCTHCNGTKLAKPQYDDILDCTDASTKIVDLIEHCFNPLKPNAPDFVAIDPKLPVTHTVALLEEVYKGNTPLKSIEAENIIEKLTTEMNSFVHFATGYLQSDDFPQQKRDYYDLIIAKLRPETAFTGFKIWVIKSHPKLLNEFSQHL